MEKYNVSLKGETKNLALYYGVDDEVIGVRECLHDWKEEDVITTDGHKTQIYAVFESSLSNLMLMATMFKKLNNSSSMSCLKHFKEEPKDEGEVIDNVDLIEYVDLLDLISVLVCNQYTVKKRTWPDYEERLDYMEEMAKYIA